MSKIKSKGTALQQMIGTVYTAVAQCLSIDASGAESETYESTTLDGGVGKTYDQTGFTESGSVSAELFYDPALAGHQALVELLTTPADETWKIVWSDTSEWAFTGAGVGFDASASLNDGVKGTLSIKIDGDITFPS